MNERKILSIALLLVGAAGFAWQQGLMPRVPAAPGGEGLQPGAGDAIVLAEVLDVTAYAVEQGKVSSTKAAAELFGAIGDIATEGESFKAKYPDELRELGREMKSVVGVDDSPRQLDGDLQAKLADWLKSKAKEYRGDVT